MPTPIQRTTEYRIVLGANLSVTYTVPDDEHGRKVVTITNTYRNVNISIPHQLAQDLLSFLEDML